MIKFQTFKYFSICIDESNDLVDFKQLVIFIRGIDCNFNISEEFLDLIKVQGKSTGLQIFKEIENIFEKYNLDFEKFCSISCDGAPNLQGQKEKGLIFRIKEKMGDHIKSFHCLLHQVKLVL